jgi:glycosyltransferase involved in cell wall biosynthesis
MTHLPEQVRLQIIGTGPLESELKHHAEMLNVASRIDFAGEVSHSEIPMYLSEADIFVRPSLSEGMGNSFIEAMAAGLPVIATPVGGIPDFLADGETGVFCKPGDPQSLAAAVERLRGDAALRGKLTTNALHMVRERYDWDLIAEKLKTQVFAKV